MSVQQSSYIKLIAMITMLIDHIGVILFPNQIIFRIIGRIALPLFAYQLGIGYEHTKDLKRYIIRIFSFGVLLQLIYTAAIYLLDINSDLGDLNIFFTLALGLLSIYFYNTGKHAGLLITLLAPIALEAFGINLDYGLYGVAIILIIYIEQKNPLRMAVLLAIMSAIYGFYFQKGIYTQMYCLIAVLFMLKPFNWKVRMPGYFFYLFYPLHLATLYLISMIIR